MKTFKQFVSESAKHGSVNLIFESGMHSLVNDLEGIVKALQHAGVQFEVVGGVAVNAHILALQRSRSFVTRDIDLLVNRSDLQRIAEAAESLGRLKLQADPLPTCALARCRLLKGCDATPTRGTKRGTRPKKPGIVRVSSTQSPLADSIAAFGAAVLLRGRGNTFYRRLHAENGHP